MNIIIDESIKANDPVKSLISKLTLILSLLFGITLIVQELLKASFIPIIPVAHFFGFGTTPMGIMAIPIFIYGIKFILFIVGMTFFLWSEQKRNAGKPFDPNQASASFMGGPRFNVDNAKSGKMIRFIVNVFAESVVWIASLWSASMLIGYLIWTNRLQNGGEPLLTMIITLGLGFYFIFNPLIQKFFDIFRRATAE